MNAPRLRRWAATNAVFLLLTGIGCSSWITHAHAAEGVQGLPVYVVRSGDTLASLSLTGTGDSLRFRELIQYNPEVLADPNALTAGMELRVPPGWKLPGARLPAGERAASPPPPVTGRDGVDLSARGAVTPSGQFGGKPPPEAELVGESMLNVTPPAAHPLDLFTFFPELGRLDDEFQQLMLRAALAGDITWAARTHATNREEEKALLEQMIEAAEQTAQLQQTRYDACQQAKLNAEILLRKFRLPDSEIKAEVGKLWEPVRELLFLEDEIWQGKLWSQLPADGAQKWTDFVEEISAIAKDLTPENIDVLLGLHQKMEVYRERFSDGMPTRDPETGEQIIIPWTPEEQVAIAGRKVDAQLEQIRVLAQGSAFRKELVESEKYEAALAAIRAEPECKRGLVDAQLFLKEQGRKLRSVEEAVSRGDSDSISADAERIARRYQAALGEVQLVDAFISNDVWAALWWKAGVALRLAGHTEEGAQMIQQAAAVDADHILPADEVPPSIQTWFTAAESIVRSYEYGALNVTVHPDMELTIDGLPKPLQFGVNEHLMLKPGIHRVVFWFDGSAPIMRLVGVVEGEDHAMVWFEPSRALDGEQQAMIGERPVLIKPEPPPIKRWHGGISGIGGMTLGRVMAGADLTVRYMPKVVGGQIGGSVFVPSEPMWVGIDEQMNVFARVHGSVVAGKRWDRLGVVGGLGAYVDPLLGAGPLATAELSVRIAREVRIGVDARFGWDLTPHFAELERWTLTGALGLWF
jgi:hypothetical protein